MYMYVYRSGKQAVGASRDWMAYCDDAARLLYIYTIYLYMYICIYIIYINRIYLYRSGKQAAGASRDWMAYCDYIYI